MSSRTSFNNTNRVARIYRRFGAYCRLSLHMVRHGVSLHEIIFRQFPYLHPNPQAPRIVTLEFTNNCDLRCVYCTSPSNLRLRGFMDRVVFQRIVEDIRRLGVRRARIVGLGESTLHPEFAPFLRELAHAAPYVSIVTNCQWRRAEETVDALLDAPASLIEVSVDSAEKETYERTRPGACFERLVANLSLLQQVKRARRSRTLTGIRVMMRPSQRAHEQELRRYWKTFADTVVPQYVLQRKDMAEVDDVYCSIQSVELTFPRCSLPFKEMNVQWNGDVPLCYLSGEQMGQPGLILGNVRTESLSVLWNSATMRQYREAHHQRETSRMPICKGCRGV